MVDLMAFLRHLTGRRDSGPAVRPERDELERRLARQEAILKAMDAQVDTQRKSGQILGRR